MTESKDKKESTVVKIEGEALKHCLVIRQDREQELGRVVAIAEMIRMVLEEKYSQLMEEAGE